MTDSANITVTNHRLRKAMSNVNDDDLKSHTKKMGDKIKSELELKIGEIIKIYPYKDKCEVKIAGTNQKTTCLIAHDILSEGMNVSGFPKGTTTHEKADEVIIPLETIYGIILDVNTGKKKQKCVVSYVNLDRPHTKNNAKSGEYKIQVGDNKISVTDKYININSSNLFVNGLPYDSPELQNYYQKTTIDNIQEDNDNQLNEISEKLDTITDLIYPIGSIYMSVNSANPSTLFGGEWVQIKDTFLLACGDTYSSDGDVATAQHGEAKHKLTVNEMPSHTHEPKYEIWNEGSDVSTSAHHVSWGSHKTSQINTLNSTGGGQAHNNMPPYMSVYVWKRTG